MRASCVCRHCRCPNFAQEGEPRGLCLVCERVELWGKNSPAYSGCRCTCRCKLQREVVSPSSSALVHERAAEELRRGHQHQHQHSRHPTNPNPLPSPVRQHSRHPTNPNPLPSPVRQHGRHATNPNPNPNPLPSPIKHGNGTGTNRLGYAHGQQRHVSENDSASAAAAAAASTHLLCADCAEQHRSNPRRHRPHGILPSSSSSPSKQPDNVNETPPQQRHHQRRVTSMGFNACKGIGFTPSSKVQAQEWKRPCLTPYARKRYNMITG
ncbi:hypothetical protein SLS62_005339 [Diatrype stigma]|uniref:Uncharacterized protein n=1 Tax=Diatrype stigma TaxID=117547 RepID=A0AAN9UTC2_9PEZI